jgi:glutathione S-transferase
MAEEIVFYTNPRSRGRMVRWMLEEVGHPYRTEIVDYATMKAPPYLAINPMGKVPALRHGAMVITETAAICAYLADAFPDAGLAPAPGSKLRGAYYRWMFYGAGPFEAAVLNKALGVDVPQGREAMVGYGSFAAVMDTVEQLTSGEAYLLGAEFSALDVYLGSQIGFGLQFNSIEKRPAFERYWERVAQRPARLRAVEIDDALIPH